MSFISKSLLLRIFTALIGVLFLYFSWHTAGTKGLYIVSSLACAALAFEVGEILLKKRTIFIPLLSVHISWFAFLFFKPDLNQLLFTSLILLLSWLISARLRNLQSKDLFLEHTAVYPFIIFSLVLPSFALYHLAAFSEIGPFFCLVFSVFLFDTLSYFCGKALGGKIFKNPLFQQASPSKTFEGAVGAAILSSATLWWLSLNWPELFPQFAQINSNAILFIIFSCLFFLTSLAGDLLESLFKRSNNVKDSSKLLPGHGGFFDRLDGVLLASIMSYLILQF